VLRRAGHSLARLRSDAMHVRHTATHVEILAPAKINLFLGVLARRPDGFHEIETLMAAVTVFDTLTFTGTPNPAIVLDCRWAYGLSAAQRASGKSSLGDLPIDSRNLVVRAVELLRQRAGHNRGASIALVKRIPAEAGLGGASSDAAAALVAANLGWNLDWPVERLAEVAAELGSDVPFFLTAGYAICKGRGERIEPRTLPRLHLAIVRPPAGLSTPGVYARCMPSGAAGGAATVAAALAKGNIAPAPPNVWKNDLQPAARSLSEWIDKSLAALDDAGAVKSQMSGSGSSCFGLCRSARHARRVANRLRARGIGLTFAATGSSGIPAVAS
jgi:4-diphosphocytidyl-2-C-methyl-D-erythritol kinase